MNIQAFIACAIVGALIVAMAIWQIRTGDVSLLHSYHTNHVQVFDRPALAKESGIGLAVVGGGTIVLGIASLTPQEALVTFILTSLGMVVMFVGVGLAIKAIVKYNGRLFG